MRERAAGAVTAAELSKELADYARVPIRLRRTGLRQAAPVPHNRKSDEQILVVCNAKLVLALCLLISWQTLFSG
jgi:nitrogenase molybdenum-iron protein alpha/beta subunit